MSGHISGLLNARIHQILLSRQSVEEASFWSWSRQAQMRELEEADWERGFTLHQPGVVITAEVEQTGFYYYAGIGWQPMEEENRLSFTYTVALDNG